MAPATIQLESPPTAAGLERIAREVPHAPDVPPEFAAVLVPLLERTAQSLRESAAKSIELLRQGLSAPAAITAVQMPVAQCVYGLLGPLSFVRFFPSLQEMVAGIGEARDRTLQRLKGEHIDAILEDVSYALDGLHAVVELLARAERAGAVDVILTPDFVGRCVVRQARMLLALELLERIAEEGSMDDHAFGLPVAEDLARTGREHYEDMRQALGFPRAVVPVVAGVESQDPTEADPETAAYFRRAFEHRDAAR